MGTSAKLSKHALFLFGWIRHSKRWYSKCFGPIAYTKNHAYSMQLCMCALASYKVSCFCYCWFGFFFYFYVFGFENLFMFSSVVHVLRVHFTVCTVCMLGCSFARYHFGCTTGDPNYALKTTRYAGFLCEWICLVCIFLTLSLVLFFFFTLFIRSFV